MLSSIGSEDPGNVGIGGIGLLDIIRLTQASVKLSKLAHELDKFR